jgi:hypothetical protein
MDLFKPRTWLASDIALLKAGSTMAGIAIGLMLPKRCKGYAPLLLGGAALLATKPVIDYLRQHLDPEAPFVPEDEGRTPAGENL